MRVALICTMTMLMLTVACSKSDTPKRSNPQPAAEGNDDDDDDDDDEDGDAPAADVNYQDDVQPLLKKFKCVTCHGAGGTKPDLSSFKKVSTAAKAVLASVEDGSMPTSGKKMAEKEVQVIADWIEGGKLEKAKIKDEEGEDEEEDKKDVVSYEGWTKGYVAGNCIGCHGATGSKPDLSTYDKVRAAGEASYNSMKAGRMPKNGQPVPADKLAKMKAWIDGDFLEKDSDAEPGANDDKVTFTANLKPWIDEHCIACHAAGGNEPLLVSKADAVKAADAMLDSVKTTMPQGNAPMAKVDYQVLADWIKDGKK